jgi:hypothetical protein
MGERNEFAILYRPAVTPREVKRGGTERASNGVNGGDGSRESPERMAGSDDV